MYLLPFSEKLDGVSRERKRKRKFTAVEDIAEYITADCSPGGGSGSDPSANSKKRVRWADIEAKRKAEESRLLMGFVMGSQWARVPEEKVTAILKGDRKT